MLRGLFRFVLVLCIVGCIGCMRVGFGDSPPKQGSSLGFALDSIQPAHGLTSGGTLVLLSGRGFTEGATVELGGAPCSSVVVNSSSLLAAVAPPHDAGTVDVVLRLGELTASLSQAFLYEGAPSLSSLRPNRGGLAGGTAIVLSGDNLSSVTSVTLGGVLCTGLVRVSSTELDCLTPPHAAGAVDVVVQAPLQSASLGGAFTYAEPHPGDLDATFGDNGVVTFARGPSAAALETFWALSVQPDDKIVVVGTMSTNDQPATRDIAVARFLPDGVVDASFGVDGVVALELSDTATSEFPEVGQGVALQSDGDIVVVGRVATVADGSLGDIAVVLLDANGDVLASRFEDVDHDAFDDSAFDVTTQTDDKIVVVGRTASASSGGRIAVLRYEAEPVSAALVPDVGFDDGVGDLGVVTTNVIAQSPEEGWAVDVDALGRLTVGGWAEIDDAPLTRHFLLLRYTSAGALDTTFSGDGIVTAQIGPGGSDEATSLAHDANGNYVLAGSASIGDTAGVSFGVARFDANGALDANFSGDGRLAWRVGVSGFDDRARGVAMQADGKIVLGGYAMVTSSGSENVVVARLNDDGTLDASFGEAGLMLTPLGASRARCYAVAVQTDGSVVCAGWSGSCSGTTECAAADAVILRYLP